MKIAAVKKITQEYTAEQLDQAQTNLLAGAALGIDVEGEDEGEQLTHLYAALWIKEHMSANNSDLNTSLRAYTAMVRQSFQ